MSKEQPTPPARRLTVNERYQAALKIMRGTYDEYMGADQGAPSNDVLKKILQAFNSMIRQVNGLPIPAKVVNIKKALAVYTGPQNPKVSQEEAWEPVSAAWQAFTISLKYEHCIKQKTN